MASGPSQDPVKFGYCPAQRGGEKKAFFNLDEDGVRRTGT